MLLLALFGLFGAVAAQDLMCECAMYYENQVTWGLQSVPLEYIGRGNVPNNACQEPSRCAELCQNAYGRLAGNLTLCNTNSVLNRCYGSNWCEVLNNQDFGTIQFGTIKLYYRIPSCETPAGNWTEAGVTFDEPLCCTGGIFESCSGQPECDPSCVNEELCECGFFADGQFDLAGEGKTAIPLVQLGREIGGGQDCNNWPSDDFTHRCDRMCVAASRNFKENTKLDTVYPMNRDLNYGQAMCYGLRSKYAAGWPQSGVQNVQLGSFTRMPGCEQPDGSHLQWCQSRQYDVHEQKLCCDGEGEWYWCPTDCSAAANEL